MDQRPATLGQTEMSTIGVGVGEPHRRAVGRRVDRQTSPSMSGRARVCPLLGTLFGQPTDGLLAE